MTSHVERLAPGIVAPLAGRVRRQLRSVLAAVKARDNLRKSLPLASGERVLATTRDRDGRWIAATDRALYHRHHHLSQTPAPRDWIRIGWEEVATAYWSDGEETLTLRGLLPTIPRRTVLQLPAGASIGALALERVAWTSLVRTEISLHEYGVAKVVGRRRPGSDEVTWLVVLDGARGDPPRLHEVIDAALRQLRTSLGV